MDNLPTFVLQLRESWKLFLIYSLASTVQSTTSPFSRRGSYLLCSTQSMWYLSVHFFAVRYCWNTQQNSVVETCSVSPPPPSPQLRLRVTVVWGSIWHCSFFAILCWDGQQQVLPSVGCEVTQWCCFGKRGRFAARWRSCWQRQLWLCVPSKSYSISCPSTAPLFNPNLMALTPALTPTSPRTGNTCEHVCVRLRSLDVFTGPGLWHWLAQMWQA